MLSERSRANVHGAATCGVILVAALFRLYALPKRGLIFWDESKFGLEGIRIESALGSLLGFHTSNSLGKAIGSAKPTHALLIALAYLILGTHDHAPLFLNALASIGEVVLVYFIARRLFSPPAALIGSLFLAVSEYDILYARSALSESDSAFFLLAGFYLWMRFMAPDGEGAKSGVRVFVRDEDDRGSATEGRATQVDDWAARWVTSFRGSASESPATHVDGWSARRVTNRRRRGRELFFAALLLGVSFTTNYRMIVYIASIVGFDFAWRIAGWNRELRTENQERAPKKRWRLRAQEVLFGWVPGLILPVAIWSGTDWLAKWRGIQLFHGDITNKNEWYLQQIPYQLHEGKQAVVHFDPVIYLQWYVARQGWVMLVLLLLGLVLAARHRSFGWLCLAVPLLFPYLAYTFAPFIVPRNLVAALPFASILSAAALVCLSQMVSWQSVGRLLLIPVALVSAIASGSLAWRLTSMHSGFVDAIGYVSRHGQSKILTGSEVPVFYLRGSGAQCDAPALPLSIRTLSAYVQVGYRFAVLDEQHTSEVTRYIRSHGLLASHFPAFGNLSLPDDPIASENSAPPRKSSRPDDVSVYWLPSLQLPKIAAPAARAITPCSRDSVT